MTPLRYVWSGGTFTRRLKLSGLVIPVWGLSRECQKSWPGEAPKWHQDSPKMAQDGPKMTQDGGKMLQDTHLRSKYVDMSKNTRFPDVFTRFHEI